jgi:hypothetical protein
MSLKVIALHLAVDFIRTSPGGPPLSTPKCALPLFEGATMNITCSSRLRRVLRALNPAFLSQCFARHPLLACCCAIPISSSQYLRASLISNLSFLGRSSLMLTFGLTSLSSCQ